MAEMEVWKYENASSSNPNKPQYYIYMLVIFNS